MVAPDLYVPSFSFTDYQSSNPTAPLPGNSLDNELFNIAQSVSELIGSLGEIQRADGALANNSVGFDQLATELNIGINIPTNWATATNYVARAYVYAPDGNLYYCNLAHTSGVFATDLGNDDWTLVISFSALFAARSFNLIRNPVFNAVQRPGATVGAGTSATGPDGHTLAATGAGLVWAILGPGFSGGPEGRLNCLSLSCAPGLTDVVVRERVEAIVAARAYGNAAKRVTAFMQIWNQSGNTLSPKLTVKHAGGADDFSSPVTDVSAVALSAVPNNGILTLAYSFDSIAGTDNGLEVDWDLGAGLNAASGSVFIGEVGLMVTPGFPIGVCVSPPVIYAPPIEQDFDSAQRFLPAFGKETGPIGHGIATSTTVAGIYVPFRTRARSSPTSLTIATVANFELVDMTGTDVAATTALTFKNASPHGAFITATVASGLTSGAGYYLRAKTALAGNLLFSGCEL